MKTSAAVLSILPLLAVAVTAEGQGNPSTWRELLESRVRPSYRYTHPPAPAPCQADAVAGTGFLITPDRAGAVGRTWLAGPNQSRWEPVNGPASQDILEVRVVEVWCGAGEPSVLVETDGYYLEVPQSRLARIDGEGMMTPGVLLVGTTPEEASQATLRELCTGEGCRLSLTNAVAYAEEVRREVEASREAERARLAEADRRAQQQTVARLEAGSAVRAQADEVARRRRAEALQRYGATEEQANAIMAGRALVGMSESMVQAALGDPTARRQEGAGAQRITIWTYPTRTIVFALGRVTEIR